MGPAGPTPPAAPAVSDDAAAGSTRCDGSLRHVCTHQQLCANSGAVGSTSGGGVLYKGSIVPEDDLPDPCIGECPHNVLSDDLRKSRVLSSFVGLHG